MLDVDSALYNSQSEEILDPKETYILVRLPKRMGSLLAFSIVLGTIPRPSMLFVICAYSLGWLRHPCVGPCEHFGFIFIQACLG